MNAEAAKIGIVAIGRNEGERLLRCLRSTAGMGHTLVYVDSGSTDGSSAAAREFGAAVLELDQGQPFTAARARNEGLKRALSNAAEALYVQFVDGDCEIASGWFERAVAEFHARPDVAAVCGRLRERHPEASVYNGLCQMEWNAEIGEIKACGGVAMYRVSCLQDVGGFDETIVAGEEPELCLRLRRRGWRIVRVDSEMATHDAAMTRLSQWWKRAVRGGYGGTDVAARFEQGDGVFSQQVRRARRWTVGWVSALAVVLLVGWASGQLRTACIVGGVIGLAPIGQALRMMVRARRRGAAMKLSVVYGALGIIAQWGHLAGQIRYWMDRRAGRHLKLIEYKAAVAGDSSPPQV